MAMTMLLQSSALPAKLAGSAPMPSKAQRCSIIVRAEGEGEKKAVQKVQIALHPIQPVRHRVCGVWQVQHACWLQMIISSQYHAKM